MADLVGTDPWRAGDREVTGAAVALQRLRNQLDAAHLQVIGELDRRELHRADGAVTAASWLRPRLRVDHGRATALVDAAARLCWFPALRQALTAAEVTWEHVTAVTAAAVPRRIDAIAGCETALVELAHRDTPRAVRVAVGRITDHTDPDGSATEPLDASGRDERRELYLHRGVDDLCNVTGAADPVAGEKLAVLLDAFEVPDDTDIPPHRRRSAAQRRADALEAICDAVLDAGLAPTVHGAKPHVVVTMDLATLLGDDKGATRTPRLRHHGALSPHRARLLALTARITVLLTMGPWRVVNVGRTMRTLPPWLRTCMMMTHRHCRGPDCDRPATWTDAHHETSWSAGADTDLDHTIPLCRAHHQLVTTGGWTVTIDPDTAICTWTSPTQRILTTSPPPP